MKIKIVKILQFCMVVATALSASQVVAEPTMPDVMLLLPTADVIKMCERWLHESGIKCSIDGSQAPEFNFTLAGISMTNGEAARGGLKRDPALGNAFPAVFGILHLASQQTDTGFKYFTGSSTIYVAQIPTHTLVETKVFNRPFWEAVSFSIPVALADSDGAKAFLASSDQQLVLERVANEKKAEKTRLAAEAEHLAAIRAQAQAAYESTDAYKALAAAKAIKACQETTIKARAAIARQTRIAAIGGYEDKNLRYRAAQAIVNCEDLTRQQWAEYKKHGGKATTVQALEAQ